MRSFVVALFSLSLLSIGCTAAPGLGSSEGELRTDCSLVRCALPLCAEDQHLVTRGNDCCPTCVANGDRPSRCATVLCAAVACDDGYELVTRGNECCPSCAPIRRVAECSTDLDCPQIYCFACPCPVSECSGHRCVTTTPDASSCGLEGI